MTEEELAGLRGPDTDGFRARSAALLRSKGLRFFPLFPINPADTPLQTRPTIVARLAGLALTVTWVLAPEERYSSADVQALAKHQDVAAQMSRQERSILAMDRKRAASEKAATIGWLMENMAILAWALGHDYEPRLDGAMIRGDPLKEVIAFSPCTVSAATVACPPPQSDTHPRACSCRRWRTCWLTRMAMPTCGAHSTSSKRRTRGGASTTQRGRCRSDRRLHRAGGRLPPLASSTSIVTCYRGWWLPARTGMMWISQPSSALSPPSCSCRVAADACRVVLCRVVWLGACHIEAFPLQVGQRWPGG